MALGSSALPPTAYLEFCARSPEACGSDRNSVLAGVVRAQAERAALLGGLPAADAALRMPAPGSVERSHPEASAAPAGGTRGGPGARNADALVMTPGLWARLTKLNALVNRRIASRTDATSYGVEDYWTAPGTDGPALGDCEDYVLEKQRVLLAAGVPRSALSIGMVTTAWGEAHAVLLVQSTAGEFVLDNLTSSIVPWWATSYRWRQRQIGGDPFNWVMIRQSAPQP